MEYILPRVWLDYARRNRIRILMYHSIAEAPGDRLAVRPDMFAAQMQYLADRHLPVISLQEACHLFETNGDLGGKVVLTFDDGYPDFLTHAAPILQQHRFTAMLFVVPQWSGTTNSVAAERNSRGDTAPRLSRDELHEIKAMGFSLGSHTMTHPDLTRLDDGALKQELVESRGLLAEWGESFFAFAYPGGRFTPRERDAVQKAGYACAVIVGGRWGNGAETDAFLLKREPMLASDSLNWFARRVNGYYEFDYLWARARGIQTR